jgi:hypothetical protein
MVVEYIKKWFHGPVVIYRVDEMHGERLMVLKGDQTQGI